MKNKPTLYIFSGLPASGKTTLAQLLSSATGAFFLRIDTIEQAIRDLCSFNVQGEGYRLSYRIAEDNLKLGNDVIADSCNPISLTRKEWQEVAEKSNASFENIEIFCSDKSVHQNRVKSRKGNIPNLILPTWQEIETREYHKWKSSRHIIDTSSNDIQTSYTELSIKLGLS